MQNTLTYKGVTYNAEIRYFGPQGHWLSKHIKKYPPVFDNLSEELRQKAEEAFNKCAFIHDIDYSGSGAKGWFKYLINAWQRHRADRRFLYNMQRAIYSIDFASIDDFEDAIRFCKMAYMAVRSLGWSFYKTA